MFEKVNPSHPDKVADRIAGAMVDLAYEKENNPKVAIEVLLGHGKCHIIAESSVKFTESEVLPIVMRITGEEPELHLTCIPQDCNLAENQNGKVRCGDNGIFKGMPVTDEQKELCRIVEDLYARWSTDGKFIKDGEKLIICQSNANSQDILDLYPGSTVNPLGFWTGGTNVDSGATNRKLGSDLADSITGGGLHGKDLSKADVSLSIYAWLKAQQTNQPVMLSCAIGDEDVDGIPYSEIVEIARNFIVERGGFEKFAEWGLVM